jgi:multiple sugar transport system substrate-binding protein
MYYRKDLFSQYGLTVPKVWSEDFLDAAKKLTMDTNGDGKADVFGITFYGDNIYAREAASFFIHGFGGKFVDKTSSGLKVVVDQPGSVKGLQYMADLVQKHKVTPQGIATYNNSALITAVQQGITGMALATNGYWGLMEDKEKSKVAGKLGYAPFPASKGMTYPGISSVSTWGMTINKQSKNKDAAWEFIQFLTSTRGDLYMALKGNGPSRSSTYNNVDYKKQAPAGYAEAVNAQLPQAVGIYTVPAGPVEWAEITGTVANQVITGAVSPEEAVKAMQKEMQATMPK